MKTLAIWLFLASSALAVPIQVIYGDAANTGFFDPSPRTPVGGNPGTSLGEQRRIAFEYALSRWSSQIGGSVAIRVSAGWSSTAPEAGGGITFASASPLNFLRNGATTSELPRDNTFFPSALADQVVGQDLIVNGTFTDISVDCNSYLDENPGFSWQWDYALNSAGSANTSFVGVVLHEIGHGLGFISVLGGTGSYNLASPTIWDALMVDGSGNAVTAMSTANRVAIQTSNNLYLDGPTIREYNEDAAARLHAPSTFDPGSSLHHYDDSTYSGNGSVNELMTPYVSFRTQVFGNLVMSTLQDMGYTLSDELPPVIDVVSPTPGRAYTSASIAAAGIFGTTSDTAAGGSSKAAGLLRVRLGLFSQSQGKWLNWTTNLFDSPTFQYAAHTKPAEIENLIPIATGSHQWNFAMPPLTDGAYEIHVTSVDQRDQGTEFVSSSFTIDNAAPSLVIEPWAEGATIFNLDGLAILASDATSVTFELIRIDGGTHWYWTGTNWSTTSFTLDTMQSGGRWRPTAALPGRNTWPAGQPVVITAHAVDAASNTTDRNLSVHRTAADTTLPVVEIDTPVSGSILANPALPALQGTASDPESGISSVTLSIARFTSGGPEFWSGTGWSASAADLPVIHDPATGRWTAPAAWTLPSGSFLANGGYSIQVTATNGETPAGTRGVGTSFTVDYHPVYTWTGYSMRDENPDNNSPFWGTPLNWSPYGTPGADDIVVIGNGDTVRSTVSRTVYAMHLEAGGLSFDNGPGSFGTLTTTDDSEWNGGALYGTWVNEGTLTLGGTFRELWVNSRLENHGMVVWDSGVTQGRETATITNHPGATWELAADGDAFSNYFGGNHFLNQGTLRRTGAGTAVFDDWRFTFGGTVEKTTGTLQLTADSTLSDGVQFTGPATFIQTGGTATVDGLVSNTGGTFQTTGGAFNSTAATLTGSFVWNGGSRGGNFTLPAGSQLAITGGCTLSTSTVFNNAGTVNWNSPDPLTGHEAVTVNNTGTWNLLTPGVPFQNYFGSNVFNNLGLLHASAAGNTELRDWTFNLAAETRSSLGTLQVNANSMLPAGAALTGAGTIEWLSSTCSLGGEVTSTVATLRKTDGTWNAAAGARIVGDWFWSGGWIHGTLENPAGSQLTIDGWSILGTGTTFDNLGTVVWNSATPLQGRENVTIQNQGLWDLAAPGKAFENYFGGNQFFNTGELRRSATTGESLLADWTYRHTGILHAAGGTVRFTSSLVLNAAGSFTGAGAFSFEGSTSLMGATTFNADSTLTSGTLTGDPAGSILGVLGWNGGWIVGTTTVTPAGTLVIGGTGDKTLGVGALLDVGGNVRWETGSVTGRENSTLAVRSGGGFSIEGAGDFVNYFGGNHLVIDPGATLVKTGSGDNRIDWAFDNDGEATASNGLLLLHGGGNSAGEFLSSAPGAIRFTGGNHTLDAGTVLAGPNEMTGGSLVALGDASARIAITGGTLGSTPPAVLSLTDASSWTDGWLTGLVDVHPAASLTVSGAGSRVIAPGSQLTVHGTLDWQGGDPIVGRDTSTIRVETGGTMNVSGTGDVFANYFGGNRLEVLGTLKKSTATDPAWLDEWYIDLSGVCLAETGDLEIRSGGALRPGVSFQGAGRTRLVGGTVAIQGTASIAGGATLDLGGSSVAAHEDGSATLSGGTTTWSGGWIYGTLTNASSFSTAGTGEKTLAPGAHLRNAATLNFGGTGVLTGRDASTLRNLAGATLNAGGTHHLGNYFGGNRLINEGTVTIGSPVGRQTMDWAFQQTATGTLSIDIGGENAAAPDFDILQATGGIQLAGTLSVQKINGYLPAEDTLFTVLSGSAPSGTFIQLIGGGFTAEYTGAVILRAGNSGIGFEEWAGEHSLSGADALAGADPDHDGISNFLEYAFNLDPTVATPKPFTAATETIDGQEWIVLGYRVWQDRVDAGLGYFAERSSTLAGWDTEGLIDEVDPDAPVIEGSEARRCRVPLAAAQQFLHLRVE